VVERATAAHREGQDVIGAFLADCCVIGPDGRKAGATQLYQAYRRCFRPRSPPRSKIYIKGRPVTVLAERVEYLDEDGKLVTESLRDFSRRTIRNRYASLDHLHGTEWRLVVIHVRAGHAGEDKAKGVQSRVNE
jgi:phage/plasmid-associated DNA primase